MVQRQTELRYSLVWATGVVSAFTNKHARATSLVNNYYGLDPAKVAGWVANHQKRWQNYKKIVKRVTMMEMDRARRRLGDTLPVNACVVLATESVLSIQKRAGEGNRRLTYPSLRRTLKS